MTRTRRTPKPVGAVIVPAERIHALVDAYLRAWNETDGEARASLLAQCWDEAGVYLDPTVRTRGRDALSDHIGGVMSRRPGAHLELVGGLNHHHGVVLFQWRLVRPGQDPGKVSTDIGEVGDSGLLVRMTGFFGT
ncbi:nuclear transport factor 2 family protein [Nocardioides sp. W7]|uniref:nuclear transport factor 2 family protein n=1 Tax=Nocardioides sp. W7 TaxID=2931390 RepID=UPI001FD37B87|nr:nuclear transport factor 2 family protein [Nocardioides sp. W7]